MPNWVQNDITIKTNNPVLIDLMQTVASQKEEIKLFDTICPIGEWDYDRACNTWGTKWEICNSYADLSIENDDIVLKVSGDTAWSFPDLFLKYVLDTFTTDAYFVNVECVWLEEQGYWGHFIDGDEIDSGLITRHDFRENTKAIQLLSDHFGVDKEWFGYDDDDDEFVDDMPLDDDE